MTILIPLRDFYRSEHLEIKKDKEYEAIDGYTTKSKKHVYLIKSESRRNTTISFENAHIYFKIVEED